MRTIFLGLLFAALLLLALGTLITRKETGTPHLPNEWASESTASWIIRGGVFDASTAVDKGLKAFVANKGYSIDRVPASAIGLYLALERREDPVRLVQLARKRLVHFPPSPEERERDQWEYSKRAPLMSLVAAALEVHSEHLLATDTIPKRQVVAPRFGTVADGEARYGLFPPGADFESTLILGYIEESDDGDSLLDHGPIEFKPSNGRGVLAGFEPVFAQ